MIRNEEDHRRDADAERWAALARLSAAESIAIGEAILTSDMMRVAEFPDDDEPRSLAIALGIDPRRA